MNRYPFATPLLTRRALLLASPAGVLHSASASDIRRELFRSSPAPGVAVMAYAFYTRPQGGDMISIEERWSRSDTVDVAYMRHSRDHGQNWTPAVEIRTGEARSGGMLRRHPRCGFVEPGGRYVEFWNEGVLPSDDPLEGMRQWNIYYRVSRDGGRQFTPVRQVIHTGSEFDSRHPLPGVWTGKNCVMLGDVSCAPLVLPDGRILLPVQITPLAPDGSLFNPGGGSTYTDAVVLIGRWRGDQLEWEMSAAIQGDPARSTRGMDEGTLGILDDGRILTVLRGSNSGRMAIPGYRWFALSDDGGRHWSKPQPWTYADGEPFFSPASCSQLLHHSSGRLYWLGNVVPENPRGNRPRYPLVIAEVGRTNGLLQRRSVRAVDTLQPGEDSSLSLSNFFAHEDRRTREVVVHMTRLFAGSRPWAGDAYRYHVPV